MDRGARHAIVHGVAKEWDTTEQLNNNKLYSQSHSVRCSAHFLTQLSATLWTIAHQAPLSMEFFRQEY